MRPEAERKLREGFQRRVHEQSDRYAAQLGHARQQAARFECGEVTAVFGTEVGGDVMPKTFVVALLSLAAIPVLIALASTGIPGTLPLLGASPFLIAGWIGLSFWTIRTPKRQIWLYACTEAFILLDDPLADAVPVSWSQVTGVGQVWTNIPRPGDEDAPRPMLTAYRLQLADGRVCEIPRSFMNVQDPYREMGQLFRALAPNTLGKTMPKFPTIDEIIATYVRSPGQIS